MEDNLMQVIYQRSIQQKLAEESLTALKKLVSSEPELKYYWANVDRIKEKSSLEESIQSWLVEAQPQRMAYHNREDGKEFLPISS